MTDKKDQMPDFDELMKCEDEDFKKEIVECLKQLYRTYIETQERYDQNMKLIGEALRQILEPAEKVMASYKDLDERVTALAKKLGEGLTLH